jgi:hypothetical protein
MKPVKDPFDIILKRLVVEIDDKHLRKRPVGNTVSTITLLDRSRELVGI